MFFIEYRDPLFGIIVFFILIFIITLLSYWLQQFKRQKDDESLQQFLEKFDSSSENAIVQEAIETTLLSDNAWFLVAEAYSIKGEYEKSIEIYKNLLKAQTSPTLRRDTMFLLAKLYFKAGFLARSKELFLEILKHYPRSPEVLKYMILTYEKLHKYQDAFDVIESLEVQNVAVTLEKAYLQSLLIIHDTKLNDATKAKKLLKIYTTHYVLHHMIFSYLFKYDAALAWKHLDLSKCASISDVLFNLPKQKCNFDIIAKHSFLRELYTIKKYINSAESSTIFEFNVLLNLDEKANATLGFEYLCDNCKEVSPFSFYRCPHCHSLDSMTIEYTLSSNSFESMYSF